jgi:hypothetical protein
MRPVLMNGRCQQRTMRAWWIRSRQLNGSHHAHSHAIHRHLLGSIKLRTTGAASTIREYPRIHFLCLHQKPCPTYRHGARSDLVYAFSGMLAKAETSGGQVAGLNIHRSVSLELSAFMLRTRSSFKCISVLVEACKMPTDIGRWQLKAVERVMRDQDRDERRAVRHRETHASDALPSWIANRRKAHFPLLPELRYRRQPPAVKQSSRLLLKSPLPARSAIHRPKKRRLDEAPQAERTPRGGQGASW